MAAPREPVATEDALADFLGQLEADLQRTKQKVQVNVEEGLDHRDRAGLWRPSGSMVRIEREEQTVGPVTIRIVEDPANRRYTYEVEEPVLTAEEKGVLAFVEEALIATLRGHPASDDPGSKRAYLAQAVERIIKEFGIKLEPPQSEKIHYFVERNFLGFGPLDALMRDPALEDVSCDGPGIPLYVFHRRHGSLRSNITFPDDKTLDGFIIRIAQASGKHISVSNPLLDATLPDRSRLQATLAREVTPRGSSFTIRRFREVPVSPVELMNWGTVSAAIASYYWMLMEEGKSMIMSGGTASGKTTSLNAWSLFIPQEKKIVSIEDTREINIPHENWIAGVARAGFGDKSVTSGVIDTFKLLEAALRQRPEYILVGEVRGQEAFTLFQAMATGHATYATMHADSPASAIRRLENPPINVPRIMVSALDCLSIQVQVRVAGRRVRRVKEVVEFLGIDNDSGELLTNTLFRWDPRTDGWTHGMKSYIVERIAESHGRNVSDVTHEWHRRALFLEALRRRGVLQYRDVAQAVAAYRSFPEETFARVTEDQPEEPAEEPSAEAAQ